jgi:hypothetical protein
MRTEARQRRAERVYHGAWWDTKKKYYYLEQSKDFSLWMHNACNYGRAYLQGRESSIFHTAHKCIG